MAEKYVKVGGAWKPVLSEHVKVGGVWKNVVTNYVKVGGAWKPIEFEKLVFVCEQTSDRLYGLNDTPSDLTGWPLYGVTISGPTDVACDQSGNSYWACSGSGVHKYTKAGAESWIKSPASIGLSAPTAICVGVDGSVYVGDTVGTVVKLDSSGAVQWTHAFGATVYSIALDYSGGYLYVGLGGTKKEIHRSLASSGNSTRILTVTSFGNVTGLAVVSGTPDLLIGTSGGYLMRWNSSGGYIWGNSGVFGTGDSVESVRAGHDGYVYASSSAGVIYKCAYADRIVQWVYTGTGCATGLGVDVFGNVYAAWYVAGESTTANCVRKINKAGVLQWTWRPYLNAQMLGVCCNPGIMAAGM